MSAVSKLRPAKVGDVVAPVFVASMVTVTGVPACAIVETNKISSATTRLSWSKSKVAQPQREGLFKKIILSFFQHSRSLLVLRHSSRWAQHLSHSMGDSRSRL